MAVRDHRARIELSRLTVAQNLPIVALV